MTTEQKTSRDSLGIAIVGAGYWGPNLIRNFESLSDCRFSGSAIKRRGRLDYVRSKWPRLRLTSDFSKVLQDEDVRAVVLATPVSTHFPLGTRAIEAGKHLFVEKPLAASSHEAKSLVDLAKKNGRTLATGHIFVYHPAVRIMKEILERNGIGDLCYAESGRVNLGPPASEVNVIWDLAVHDVSILLDLWKKNPVEVQAFGRNFLNSSLIDVAFFNLRFEDGTLSSHHVSWMSPQKVRRFSSPGQRALFCSMTPSPRESSRSSIRGSTAGSVFRTTRSRSFSTNRARFELLSCPPTSHSSTSADIFSTASGTV